MRFSDIPGHADVKKRLRQMVDDGQVPHALLLEGPEGIGKHALARAFVSYMSCTNRRDGDSCGVCPACVQQDRMQYVDTIYSYPFVKVKGESKEKPTVASEYYREFVEFVNESPFMDKALWREYLGSPNTKPTIFVSEASNLIHRLSIAPNLSSHHYLILWQPDRLYNDAANKLLKIIEEPPGDTVIIMTSDAPNNILPTIYSRTQRIKVNRLSDDEIARWMVDNTETDPETAADIAPLARGSVLEAIRLANNRDDSQRFLSYFISLMRLAYQRDIFALKDWSMEMAALKREELVEFLRYMASMIRENFVANLRDASLNLMNSQERDFSVKFAPFINERNVEALYDAATQAITDITANVNSKIVMFDLCLTVILKLKE